MTAKDTVGDRAMGASYLPANLCLPNQPWMKWFSAQIIQHLRPLFHLGESPAMSSAILAEASDTKRSRSAEGSASSPSRRKKSEHAQDGPSHSLQIGAKAKVGKRDYKGVDRRGLPGRRRNDEVGEADDGGGEGEGKARLPKKKAAVLLGCVVPSHLSS